MKIYQPDYDEKIWDDKEFYGWMVYRSKKKAQANFPTLEIIEYKTGDIEDPTFVD